MSVREQFHGISNEEFDNIREKYNVNWIIINQVNEDVIRYLDETNKIDKISIGECMLYKY